MGELLQPWHLVVLSFLFFTTSPSASDFLRLDAPESIEQVHRTCKNNGAGNGLASVDSVIQPCLAIFCRVFHS